MTRLNVSGVTEAAGAVNVGWAANGSDKVTAVPPVWVHLNQLGPGWGHGRVRHSTVSASVPLPCSVTVEPCVTVWLEPASLTGAVLTAGKTLACTWSALVPLAAGSPKAVFKPAQPNPVAAGMAKVLSANVDMPVLGS